MTLLAVVLMFLHIAMHPQPQPAPTPASPITPSAPTREQSVAAVLDHLHDYAAKADGAKYFALFADDGIFLGTDATERWTVEQFKAYAKPYFDKGQGWTYHPRQRHISFNAAGDTAWFDELLDNAKLGPCRGSGVLTRTAAGDWKISQYNLAKVVPNDKMDEVVKAIGTP